MATRVKVTNGSAVGIKAVIDPQGKGVPMNVYTVSCDDIVFRTCVGASEAGSGSSTIRLTDDGSDAETSPSQSSSS